MQAEPTPVFDKYKTVILDCDGVILDSNAFKNKAFEDVLKRKGFKDQDINQFIDYHKKNGGISRYAKFEYFQRQILRQSFDEDLHETLLNEFAVECRVQYMGSLFTDGFDRLIEYLHKKGKNVFIASGSDEAELRYVFKQRKADHYFNTIHGSPKPKLDIVRELIGSHTDCIFVGDSVIDLDIAITLNIDFIALTGYSDNPAALEKKAAQFFFPVYKRFSEILF